MDNKTRTMMALIGSFLLLFVGMFRILTESMTFTSLFVAYVFSITGLFGVVINGVVLRRLQTKE
ncbi:hypothetical protein N0O92_08590 [Alkalihalobacillus sp. MEB130]|uniref:hypothetical protein n=1 Tax=Alkalihalobacillus sp. MEB130 TaxID=2976704 RepID=UPI0028DEB4A9|nr:hypothetical protein [Alkalihalobacillus sp. MEB130]MDT8860290.1 hypothetical protein [Alkalihalobacillus sp. MEB130]